MIERSALVVGGGIGGLATAVALRRYDWQVTVVERAPAFTAVGAGISLWPNALRALDALDLGEQVRKRASLGGSAGVQTRTGTWLSRTDPAELERRHGPLVMLHRADLLDILLSALPAETLRTDVTVHEVHGDGIVVHSAGEDRADLVVGADGIRSTVRRAIWPGAPEPRYAGYTAWRLVTPPVPVESGVETWGRGERFGYMPLADGRVYAYATANAPEGTEAGLPELRGRFGSWHDPIPALLEAADAEAVVQHDIYELPPLKNYTAGKAVLVGDAAHAMTPDLGQGGCQALEDAVELAAAMEHGGLPRYDRIRRPRTQMIARRARQIGAVGQWASPITAGLRDLAVRLVPGDAMLLTLSPVLRWAPPSPVR